MENNRAKDNDVMTVADVADLLHRHPVTIRRMASNNELPATKIGGEWLFYRPNILALFDANQAKDTTKWQSGSEATAFTMPTSLSKVRHALSALASHRTKEKRKSTTTS